MTRLQLNRPAEWGSLLPSSRSCWVAQKELISHLILLTCDLWKSLCPAKFRKRIRLHVKQKGEKKYAALSVTNFTLVIGRIICQESGSARGFSYWGPVSFFLDCKKKYFEASVIVQIKA